MFIWVFYFDMGGYQDQNLKRDICDLEGNISFLGYYLKGRFIISFRESFIVFIILN